MIHVDTSALIAALTGERRAAPVLRGFIRDGIRLGVSTLVLYEWWRGPRTDEELADQEALFPSRTALAFGLAEATLAAALSRRVKRPHGREIDLAIAACALVENAALWTLNPQDYHDIPRLEMIGE